jgi:hypothetical protein
MSKTTDNEFPGGFRVAINVVTPVVNTDGLSTGRLYKKENRPQEGSKEEKELLTGFLLWRQYWRHFWGSFFAGAYLPQKLDLLPRLESEHNSV